MTVGRSPWDYLGIESADHLRRSGETLTQVCDRGGKAICMTANIFRAKADLPRMRTERFVVEINTAPS